MSIHHLMSRMARRMASSKTLVLCGTLGAALLMAPAPAVGQLAAIGEAMTPEYFSRDLIVFVEALDLDETQQVMVEILFDDYESDFEAGFAMMSENIEGMRDQIAESRGDEQAVLEMVLAPIQDWVSEREKLGTQLLANVEVILVPEQREKWPAFTQRLYREKHLRDGRFDGESVNLFQVVRNLDLEPQVTEMIAEQLADYGTALDEVLRRRSAVLRAGAKDGLLATINNSAAVDPERLIAARVAVRQVNDDYLELISAALPSPWNTEFRKRVLTSAYPRVYRKTPAERILGEAVAREDLTQEIHDQIELLLTAYLGELDSFNTRVLDSIRTNDPETERQKAINQQIRGDGGTPLRFDNPTRDLLRERDEMGKRYIQMLRDLLTPEQFLELPGSMRWIPRDERPQKPLPEGSGGGAAANGLSLTKPTKPTGKPDGPKLDDPAGVSDQ